MGLDESTYSRRLLCSSFSTVPYHYSTLWAFYRIARQRTRIPGVIGYAGSAFLRAVPQGSQKVQPMPTTIMWEVTFSLTPDLE